MIQLACRAHDGRQIACRAAPPLAHLSIPKLTLQGLLVKHWIAIIAATIQLLLAVVSCSNRHITGVYAKLTSRYRCGIGNQPSSAALPPSAAHSPALLCPALPS
mgnify:CR=1 FL=1